jgi:hypothetical protein
MNLYKGPRDKTRGGNKNNIWFRLLAVLDNIPRVIDNAAKSCIVLPKPTIAHIVFTIDHTGLIGSLRWDFYPTSVLAGLRGHGNGGHCYGFVGNHPLQLAFSQVI